MLLQEIVTLGNTETKDLFKEKICIIKEAYYKNKKKKEGDSKYFRQCQSKCYPDILRCIFRLICIVLLICLLNFICVLNFPQIGNYRLHLGFPIKANPTCVCVCVYIWVFLICMSDIASVLPLLSYRRSKVIPLHWYWFICFTVGTIFFSLYPMASSANSAKWITPWDLSGGLL